jgi:hypothetical protein
MRRVGRVGSVSCALALSCCFLVACGESTHTPGTDGGGPAVDAHVAPGVDGGTPTPTGDLPCDVLEVVGTRCQTCHAATPLFGAPMPLVTSAHFHAPAPTMPAEAVHERAMVRIHSTTSPMPPVTAPALSTTELATLDAWLAAGAPMRAAGVTCEEPPPPPPPDELDCEPTHSFRAHASGGATAPYPLGPGSANQYICFTFRSPFTTTQQATAWGPTIDDERVVHHYILYRTQTPQADGGVGPCNMPADATFLMGWAPGGGVSEMPADVGLELSQDGDEWLILQVHYWNAAAIPDVVDASGVEICTTDTPRTHEAGVLTFGSTAIAIPARAMDHSVSGTCSAALTSFLPEPLHVIASGPHMHTLGTSFETVILRGGTTPEMLVRVDPWDFDSQTSYAHDPEVLIRPGDAVRTTCTYANPGSTLVTFGEETEDEMCFNFMMVYPIDILGTAPRYCSDS